MQHAFGKTTTIAALDIGSSKVSCIIAKVNKDKKITVVGYGHNASKGVKKGVITDIDEATIAVGNAVQDAEQMANEHVDKIIINVGGEKVKSMSKSSSIQLNKNRPITDADIEKVYQKATAKINIGEYNLLHCIHNGYHLDNGESLKDPHNLFAEELSIDILLGIVPEQIFRNLNTVIENAHLEISAKVFDAYASGLACLVKDEMEMGTTIVDMGGGTTSMASFRDGHPIYFASIPVGGSNVTNDIACGLATSFSHAERLKTLHGCAFQTQQDTIDTVNVYPVGEEDDSCIKQVPRSELIDIITPRIEETFEIVSKKLSEAGFANDTSHRVVLTGGASQLPGVVDVAAMVLDKQVRLGKPRNIFNLPDVLTSAGFSSCVGLLSFYVNFSERKPKRVITKSVSSGNGLMDNINMWLRAMWG